MGSSPALTATWLALAVLVIVLGAYIVYSRQVYD